MSDKHGADQSESRN